MANESYEYRTTLRGRASRGRLRTMYRNEAESYAAETAGVAHTPYGTVEVNAVVWRDGVQTILLYTVRNGVLHGRWERRRRPLSERGLVTLARRWAERLDADDVDGADADAQSATITPQQAADLDALIDEVGVDRRNVLQWAGVARLEDLPAEKYGVVVRMLERRRGGIVRGWVRPC